MTANTFRTERRWLRQAFLSLAAATLVPTAAFAELSHDVRQISGVLAEQAVEASRKIDSHTEAVRMKGIFEQFLNTLARDNQLIAVNNVQTFADKKQIGVGFVTVSKPPIVIQVAARDGQLLMEHATCGDETIVDFDSRRQFDELADQLKRAAAEASLVDASSAEKLRTALEPTFQAANLSLRMLHEPGFCTMTAEGKGVQMNAWALEGKAEVKVSAD
jgi:hypothetical protein